VIQLVQHPGGESATDYVRGVTGLTTCFNVGVLYYQQQLVEKTVVKSYVQRSTSHTWMILHIVLSLFILFFASGIKLVYDTSSDDDPHEETIEDRELKEEILMCTSAAISLAIIFYLRMQYKGLPMYHITFFSNRTLAYGFRFLLSVCIAGIPLVTRSPTHTSAILCGVTSLLVIQVMACHHIINASCSHLATNTCHNNTFNSLLSLAPTNATHCTGNICLPTLAAPKLCLRHSLFDGASAAFRHVLFGLGRREGADLLSALTAS
jgi:hypothetical protein